MPRKAMLAAVFGLLPIFLASKAFSHSSKVDYPSTVRFADKALSFIVNSQVKKTVGIRQFKGEWQSDMELDRDFILLGKKGYKAKDSNLFTTGAIHNILAQIILLYPEYGYLRPVLIDAMDNLLRYKKPNADTYGFWQYLPKRPHILSEDDKSLPLIRRSNNFFIKKKIVNYAENVPDDADDTAMMLKAYKLHHKVTGHQVARVQSISPIFDQYLDVKRKRMVNLYNIKGRGKHATSAFLTWFARERRNFSTAVPKQDKVYLPLGVNDVDCVVNANVLDTLTYYNELEQSKGSKYACQYLRDSIKKNRSKICGMYYPNWYNFPYSVGKAVESGVTCLDEQKGQMVSWLIGKQNSNGSWKSYKIKHKGREDIQSSAFALGSLLRLGDFQDPHTRKSIERGFSYLISKAIEDSRGIHWPGGIFFSGGTIVRKTVIWRSDAYTTALVLEALVKYRRLLEMESAMELNL